MSRYNQLYKIKNMVKNNLQKNNTKETYQNTTLQKLEVLNKISKALSSVTDLNKLYISIFGQINKVFDIHSFVIAQYRESLGGIRYVFTADIVEGELQYTEPSEKVFPLNEIIKDVLNGNPKLINRIDGEPDYIMPRFGDINKVSASIMIAPSISKNKTLGFISVQSYKKNAYTEEDLDFFSSIANFAAIAIDNASLIEDLKKINFELYAQYNIIQAISSSLNLDKVFEQIVWYGKSFFDVNRFAIFLREGNELVHYITYCDEGFNRDLVIMPDNISISGWVVQNKKPLFIYDINKDERFIQWGGVLPYPACSYIGAPLMIRGECIGLLRAITYKYRDFTEKEMELLVNLANQASIAIENARLYEQLEESEKKYKGIISNIKDIIFVLNEIGVYTYISPQCKDSLGYTPEELIGKVFIPYIHPDDLTNVVKTFKKAIEEKQDEKNLLVRFVRKDRNLVWHSIRISPVIDNDKVSGIIGVSRDITEIKELSQMLQKSEESFKKIFENSPIAIATINKQGQFETINPAYIKIFGVESPEEYILNVNALDPHIPLSEKFYEETTNLINGKPVEKYGTRHICHSNKKEIYLNIKGVPLFNEKNEVTGGLIFCEDITERKKVEDSLFQSQKMQSIGTLAGGVAHNLNNILGGILGYASLTKSEVEKDSEVYSRLDIIEKASIRAANLVSELLTFSRGGRFNLAPVYLNDLIKDLIIVLKDSFDKSIHFEKSLTNNLWHIIGDRNQIIQALMNICINSRDAMPYGGTITFKINNVTLNSDVSPNVEGFIPGDYVAVTISDTGAGIPNEIKNRIFEPFFSTKGIGRGLGLATVYGIMKNHSAFIECESELGKGTTFTIYFPKIIHPSYDFDEIILHSKGGNETILVVEDEEVLRQLIKTALSKLGYNPITASDGPEAIEIYKKEKTKIDLIILDLIMPKMSGKETFKRLKDINSKVKVILTSGYALNESVKQLFGDGIIDFIKKPYKISDLANRIRQILDASVST